LKYGVKMIEEIIKKLQQMNVSSEALQELNDVAKKLLSCDPQALDGNISEYFIRDKFGDQTYIVVRKMYHEFIGYDADGKNKNSQESKNKKLLGK
jgi:hypothetical protein